MRCGGVKMTDVKAAGVKAPGLGLMPERRPGVKAATLLAAGLLAAALLLAGCGAGGENPAPAVPAPAETESAAPAMPAPAETESAAPAVGAAEENKPDAAPAGSTAAENGTPEAFPPETENTELEDAMRLFIGETEVPVTWEENASVEALRALCPVTVQMSMYGGFEQVGPLGRSIVREDVQTVTASGDIVLYSGNQIVIFYGANSWAYTRLGHVNLPQQEMERLLANGDVTVTLK